MRLLVNYLFAKINDKIDNIDFKNSISKYNL